MRSAAAWRGFRGAGALDRADAARYAAGCGPVRLEA